MKGWRSELIPDREITIGRSTECDICLKEKKISRKHTSISVTKNRVKIQDLQSANGTYLNAKKIDAGEIHNQDKIRVGSSILLVSIRHPKDATAIDYGSGPDEDKSFLIEVSGDEHAVQTTSKAKKLSGNLSMLPLPDLLQNLSQNKTNGILRINSHQEGMIAIVKGSIVSAHIVSSVGGVKALYRMLGWNQGEFELISLPPTFNEDTLSHRISDSLEMLLMEGFRQMDETQKIQKTLPPLSSSLKLNPKLIAPLSELKPELLDLLQLIHNERKIETILDASSYTDLETCKMIFFLMKKNYVVAG